MADVGLINGVIKGVTRALEVSVAEPEPRNPDSRLEDRALLLTEVDLLSAERQRHSYDYSRGLGLTYALLVVVDDVLLEML